MQTWTYQFTSPVGDEGEQLERPGRSDQEASGSVATARMRLLLGAALRMEDQVLDAFFAQFAHNSGGNRPAAASATTSATSPPQSLPDVKTAWLRAVEALPAPKPVSDDSPDAVFATLDGRQELLNLFRW